ncbi:MAG: hypothetical protein LBD23_09515 [Oscillospiraceae bacterium]|jgi:hypothetical protein|nr:hypothetical protein [Oscillospiraceae bacterium]
MATKTNGKFSNGKDAGHFIAAIVDLWKGFGKIDVLTQNNKIAFDKYIKNYNIPSTGKDEYSIDDDKLIDIVIEILKTDKNKLINKVVGGSFELHNPIDRSLLKGRKANLKELIKNSPKRNSNNDLKSFGGVL